MKFDFHCRQAEFVHKVNRFTAELILGGTRVLAHIPTSGRLTELLQPGAKCYLKEVNNPNRKTGYDLLLVLYKGNLVHINAIGVNKLLLESIEQGEILEFKGYEPRSEYSWGNSRFDLYLTHPRRKHILIEAKSVTLCEDGIAIFPDAPTERGVKHLLELKRAVGEGFKAYSIFVAQRRDATIVRPNWVTDPAFAQTLLEVSKAGVSIRCFKCNVSLSGISLGDKISIDLKKPIG